MVICNSCGAALTDGLAFCSECGAAAPHPTAVVSSHAARVERGPEADTSSAAAVGPPMPAASRSSTKIIIVAFGGVIILLIAIIGLLSLRRDSSPNSPDNLAASLRKAIASGRLVDGSSDDAYSYFTRLNALDPQNKALNEGKTRLLPQLRQLGDNVFRKRVELSIEILSELDWIKAQHAYEWSHALEPADKGIEARWKYASANVAKVQGRRADAESNFNTALQLDPSWALPQNDLGYLWASSKRHSDAIPLYQRAIDLQPDWDIPYNNMGTAYYYLENYDAAVEWYQRAVEVNGQWATPHAWLGTIFENKKLSAEAIQEYQATLNLYNPSRDRIITADISKKISLLEASR